MSRLRAPTSDQIPAAAQLRPSRRCAHGDVIRDAWSAVTIELDHAPADRLLTADEVSRILRVPRSTVYELAHRRIPMLKVGRRTLFDQELLRQWIAQRTVRPRR